MIRIGEQQTLTVIELTTHGAYLAEEASVTPGKKAADRVLLPGRYLSGKEQTGDRIEVFVYLDSEDRPVATTQMPKLMLHQVGRLMVRETGRIGAFLDWGLPKDLLLPFGGQTAPVHKGDSVLCAVILDKSGRLAATMNVYEYLKNHAPYEAGDWVEGTVYETSHNFGAFVAVDDVWSGLIPKKELVGELRPGTGVRVRVTAVQPDGRLMLAVRDKAWLQMNVDAQMILDHLAENGRIPFTDKADPEQIRQVFGMSKNEFKRAIGRLLKEGRVSVGEGEIRPIT